MAKRSAKQIAATKRLVALNKARAKGRSAPKAKAKKAKTKGKAPWNKGKTLTHLASIPGYSRSPHVSGHQRHVNPATILMVPGKGGVYSMSKGGGKKKKSGHRRRNPVGILNLGLALGAGLLAGVGVTLASAIFAPTSMKAAVGITGAGVLGGVALGATVAPLIGVALAVGSAAPLAVREAAGRIYQKLTAPKTTTQGLGAVTSAGSHQQAAQQTGMGAPPHNPYGMGAPPKNPFGMGAAQRNPFGMNALEGMGAIVLANNPMQAGQMIGALVGRQFQFV